MVFLDKKKLTQITRRLNALVHYVEETVGVHEPDRMEEFNAVWCDTLAKRLQRTIFMVVEGRENYTIKELYRYPEGMYDDDDSSLEEWETTLLIQLEQTVGQYDRMIRVYEAGDRIGTLAQLRFLLQYVKVLRAIVNSRPE